MNGKKQRYYYSNVPLFAMDGLHSEPTGRIYHLSSYLITLCMNGQWSIYIPLIISLL